MSTETCETTTSPPQDAKEAMRTWGLKSRTSSVPVAGISSIASTAKKAKIAQHSRWPIVASAKK